MFMESKDRSRQKNIFCAGLVLIGFDFGFDFRKDAVAGGADGRFGFIVER